MEQAVSLGYKDLIRLNIGGTIFQCHTETLKTFPDSLLAHIDETADNYIFEKEEYFFDRNPLLFAYILDASRKGTIHLPKDMCGVTFREELDFWKISPRYVAPCCLEALYKSDEDIVTMEKLMKNFQENTNVCLLLKEKVSLKQKIWLFLDEPKSSKAAMIWCYFISILIIVSTILEAMSTLPQFTVDFPEDEKRVFYQMGNLIGWSNSSIERIQTMKPRSYLTIIDVIIHVVLTLEVVLGFFVCPCKFSFAKCFSRIVVVLGYLSFWISFSIEENLSILDNAHKIRAYLFVKHIVILQLARLLYLTKREPAFKTMALTFSASKHELKILIFMLAILISSFGFVMFMTEVVQSSTMTNVFTAMYWALITLTTVGYGHYIPETIPGHVIAGICAVCGVVCLALPIGVIAASFHTYYTFQKYAQKHVEMYRKDLPCNDELKPIRMKELYVSKKQQSDIL